MDGSATLDVDQIAAAGGGDILQFEMSGCSRTRLLGVHLRTTYGGMAQGHVGRYAFPYMDSSRFASKLFC